MTADSLPRFHRLDERVVSFSGYNGRGIAPGTVFGRVLAGHVLGRSRNEELPLPATPPVPQRLRAGEGSLLRAGQPDRASLVADLN